MVTLSPADHTRWHTAPTMAHRTHDSTAGSWIPRTTTPTNGLHFVQLNEAPPDHLLQRKHSWRENACLRVWQGKKQQQKTAIYTLLTTFRDLVQTRTEEYCRGCISKLTNLQPKNLLYWLASLLTSAARSEDGSKFNNFNGHHAAAQFILCICCLYTITIRPDSYTAYRVYCKQ